MSEKENMLAGQPYDAQDPELVSARISTRSLLRQLNTAPEMASADARRPLLTTLFGEAAQTLQLEPPFFCDYGQNIALGKNVFINANCTILDCARVEIGDNTLIAPNVQIYTAEHPLNPKERLQGKESARPVKIGKNVWIGGGAIILPGITIGDNAVIGAGSVVTHDIAPLSVAVGNPARVKRQFYDFKRD